MKLEQSPCTNKRNLKSTAHSIYLKCYFQTCVYKKKPDLFLWSSLFEAVLFMCRTLQGQFLYGVQIWRIPRMANDVLQNEARNSLAMVIENINGKSKLPPFIWPLSIPLYLLQTYVWAKLEFNLKIDWHNELGIWMSTEMTKKTPAQQWAPTD